MIVLLAVVLAGGGVVLTILGQWTDEAGGRNWECWGRSREEEEIDELHVEV